MSTQVTTWPEEVYQLDLDGPIPETPANGQYEASTQSLALPSTFENVPVMLLMAFFAAELAFVAVGIGAILASVAALSW